MSARGFSLLEVMVGGVIGLFAIAMVLSIFLSQNKAFQALDMTRQASSSGRDAALDMEVSLKRAGFGLDPNLAFDFSCPVGSNCHDHIDGPDEITFYARNPNYAWQAQNVALGCNTVGGCFVAGNVWTITATSATTVTVTLKAGDVFHKGRIVLAVCPNGANPVFATVTARQAAAGSNNVSVAINTTGIFANNAFSACHAQTGSALFLIDKYHYFLTALNNEPWLVLDSGLDYNADGAVPPTDVNDLVPIARDVEDMQIAYQLGSPGGTGPDTNHDWVVGNDPGQQEEPSTAAVAPLAGVLNGSLHPGNIRGVRVTLVMRSRQRDATLVESTVSPSGDPAFTSENRNDVTGITVSQYRRFPQTFSVATRNMSVPNPYLLF